jgi:hypothetical protein
VAFDKAKFLAPKLETETVDVPGFGPVTVRALTGTDYDRFEAACRGGQADRALLTRLAAVDPETGLHLFGDDDLPALGKLPVKAIEPLCKAAFRLCGVGEDYGKN